MALEVKDIIALGRQDSKGLHLPIKFEFGRTVTDISKARIVNVDGEYVILLNIIDGGEGCTD